jgi:hypothetical protein
MTGWIFMQKLFSILCLIVFSSCTTIHFRSNQSIPVTFEGNPNHQKEVTVEGKRFFYFWGVDPDYQEVFIDEEVRKAGYDGISKVIIYEPKNPQDQLISWLTFGLYMPRGFVITGFTTGNMIPDDLVDSAPQSNPLEDDSKEDKDTE